MCLGPHSEVTGRERKVPGSAFVGVRDGALEFHGFTIGELET